MVYACFSSRTNSFSIRFVLFFSFLSSFFAPDFVHFDSFISMNCSRIFHGLYKNLFGLLFFFHLLFGTIFILIVCGLFSWYGGGALWLRLTVRYNRAWCTPTSKYIYFCRGVPHHQKIRIMFYVESLRYTSYVHDGPERRQWKKSGIKPTKYERMREKTRRKENVYNSISQYFLRLHVQPIEWQWVCVK